MVDDQQGKNLRDDFVASVRLALIPGIGPRTRQSLIGALGTAEAILSAPAWRLKSVPGVGEKLSHRIASSGTDIDAEAEIRRCVSKNITMLCDSSPEYPRLLNEICDPPGLLFIRGQLLPSDGLSLAIVGSRHATSYGIAQAKRFASGLSRAGYTIVSGLARGIDSAAHRGALSAGGRTIAVLGGGVLNIYPPEHAPLADEIESQGAVISEAAPLSRPTSGAFPQRNRLITGLSLGVVVVEAAERSGALISARHAMEQGREVFAVPGRADSRLSRGCHELIRDGAKLVDTIEHVTEELGPLVQGVTRDGEPALLHPAELKLNDVERVILAEIETCPTSIDEIVARSGLPIPKVLSTISVLEMSRLVRRVSGNQVVRPT